MPPEYALFVNINIHATMQVELIIDMLDLLYPIFQNKSKDTIKENDRKFPCSNCNCDNLSTEHKYKFKNA